MYGGETGKRKISFGASDLFVMGALSVSVILFVLGIACLLAPNPIAIQPLTYAGKVMTVDTAGKTVTVQSGLNDHRTFNWKNDVAVSKCGGLEAWSSIKPGEEITVSYFDKAAGRNADFAALSPGMTESC